MTLTRRIALAAAVLTLFSVSLIGGTAFIILRGQVLDTMDHSLQHSAEDVARVIQSRLETIADNLNNLASNTLVANALVDNEGRQRYLSSFLSSYETIAGLPVNLLLTDFMGQALSNPNGHRPQYDPARVARVVSRNRGEATLVVENNTHWMVMAQPVIFANTGMPEGALILQFPIDKLMTLPTEVAHINDWRHSAHFALFIGETIPADTPLRTGIERPANGVSLRYPIALPDVFSPLQAELEVIIDPFHFNAPLRHLVLTSTVMAVLVVTLVAVISLFMGRTLTRRLRELEEGAHQIALKGAERRRLPISGQDEVTSLAQSFNQLIADLQQAYDKLRVKSESLEQALGEARRARREAEHANKAKSLFLANMSHELRTPLNAILGFSQILERDGTLDEEQRHSIGTIYRSGEHLLSLINDVLEISRIEAGRVDLVENPFDLKEMLEAVSEIVRLRAAEKGLTLQLLISAEVPNYIEADQRKLRQMLINLLGNAVKFTDEGWVRLKVDYDKERLLVEVADSGHGIAEEEQLRIFEPFHQAEGVPHSDEGTGLGLAITREFTQLMGGTITLTSHLGKGTTFHIELPCKRVEDAPLAKRKTTEQGVVALLPNQPDYRVLVVDDKPEGRELLVNLLESVGFKLRSASNGAEAIEVFHAWRPHIIWMDMRMPVMDGYEATRRIKSSAEGKGTIIVALTASAFEENRAEVLAAGCDHFMRKPVNTDEVFELMARYLGVGYRYAPVPKELDAEQPTTALADLNKEMQGLPGEIRRKLGEAAASLDMSSARELIGIIGSTRPMLADRLKQLVTEYRYDELARLCGQGGSDEQ